MENAVRIVCPPGENEGSRAVLGVGVGAYKTLQEQQDLRSASYVVLYFEAVALGPVLIRQKHVFKNLLGVCPNNKEG